MYFFHTTPVYPWLSFWRLEPPGRWILSIWQEAMLFCAWQRATDGVRGRVIRHSTDRRCPSAYYLVLITLPQYETSIHIHRLIFIPIPQISLGWLTWKTEHSVPECGFEGLKTYQAPAHIWDLPRSWKSLLLIYKIFDRSKIGLSHQIRGPTTVKMGYNWLQL